MPEVRHAPFRADHVGSLLRAPRLKEARHRHFDEHAIDAAALRRIEDAEIDRVVARQQEVGLPVVTDGELRRSFWHYDFLAGLEGLELREKSESIHFRHANLKPLFPAVAGRLSGKNHPMVADFRYLAGIAHVQPKITIPAPSAAHFRVRPEDIEPPEYQDRAAYFADLTAAYRDVVKEFYDAGCRYIQLDEVYIAYLCDDKLRAETRERGMDPDQLIREYAAMIDGAVRDRPKDMVAAMHLCRGNFQSTWVAEGGYDPAADALFNAIDIDVYFMEYDSDRAGGLEPLRLLPKGAKRVMPGFITTKSAELESVDAIARRFEEAAKYADMDQLGIAPQCGFSSTEEGNLVTEDDQWKKLALVVEVAEKLWGGVA